MDAVTEPTVAAADNIVSQTAVPAGGTTPQQVLVAPKVSREELKSMLAELVSEVKGGQLDEELVQSLRIELNAAKADFLAAINHVDETIAKLLKDSQ